MVSIPGGHSRRSATTAYTNRKREMTSSVREKPLAICLHVIQIPSSSAFALAAWRCTRRPHASGAMKPTSTARWIGPAATGDTGAGGGDDATSASDGAAGDDGAASGGDGGDGGGGGDSAPLDLPCQIAGKVVHFAGAQGDYIHPGVDTITSTSAFTA